MYLYLHIPFCVSRCIYCDFYVVLNKYGGQDAYLDAVHREIDLRFSQIATVNHPPFIETLYVGGGTPSLLPAMAYQGILAHLRQFMPLADHAEMTLEANPGAYPSEMKDHPEAYLEAGFNRISVGIQSLNNTELKKLSRLHSAEQAMDFVQQLHAKGWRNISIDLMYGLPLQTLESWQDTMAKVLALPIQHVSMYGLKVEDNTPLAKLSTLPSSMAAYPLPDDELATQMYQQATVQLQQAGFAQYEFSNFARPGYESRHNLNYWNNGEYLALGASAHGYWQNTRYETVRDLQTYLENPLAGTGAVCSPQEKLENAIIFGLRKTQGIHIPSLEQAFQIDFNAQYGPIVKKFAEYFIFSHAGYLSLTPEAIPISNYILSEFLTSSS